MACDFPTRNCDRRTRGCLACLLIQWFRVQSRTRNQPRSAALLFKVDPKRNGVYCQFYDAELMVGLLQEKSNSVRS